MNAVSRFLNAPPEALPSWAVGARAAILAVAVLASIAAPIAGVLLAAGAAVGGLWFLYDKFLG